MPSKTASKFIHEIAEGSDAINKSCPAILVGSLHGALAAYEAAKLGELAHPWAMGAIYRAAELGEGMPAKLCEPCEASARQAQTAKWLSELCGATPNRRIDWSLAGPKMSLAGFCRGIDSRMDVALSHARSSGAHGELSARIAVGLGIFEAADGNELCAKVRDALRASHGLSDAGWRGLAKSDELRERIAAPLEALGSRKAMERKRQALEESPARTNRIGLGTGPPTRLGRRWTLPHGG